MQFAQATAHKLPVRGERMPNIIQTIKLGNTTIHFASDHIATGAELEKVHDEISQVAYAIWDKLSVEEQLELNNESA